MTTSEREEMVAGRVEGKVAFITGAARGQGRAHAVRLAAEGADIIAVDLCAQAETVQYPMATPEDLDETVRQVEALGRGILAVKADVRDLAELCRVVDEGVSRFGRLDIVVGNAGISAPTAMVDMTEEIWDTMIEVNLTGVWKTVKAALPHLLAGGRGGSIVLTSSLAAQQANDNLAHYSAAKAGLIGFMRVLAREMGPHEIRVNSIHPGFVATPMVMNESKYRLFRPELENPTRADMEELTRSRHAMPVAAIEAEDVANLVLFLCSDEARYITGTAQIIDAGGDLL